MSDREMTNNELKIFCEGEFRFIKEDLVDVKSRLENIEKELHGPGNGKPGISIRLDRLENSQKSAEESKKNRASIGIRVDRSENIKNWFLALAAIVATASLGAFLTHYFSLLGK